MKYLGLDGTGRYVEDTGEVSLGPVDFFFCFGTLGKRVTRISSAVGPESLVGGY